MMAVTGHMYADDERTPVYFILDVCQSYYDALKKGEMRAVSVYPAIHYDDPDVLIVRSPDHDVLKLRVTHIAHPEFLIGKASVQKCVTLSVKKMWWIDRLVDWWLHLDDLY